MKKFIKKILNSKYYKICNKKVFINNQEIIGFEDTVSNDKCLFNFEMTSQNGEYYTMNKQIEIFIKL